MRTHTRLALIAFAVTAVGSGCVTLGTHEQLEKEHTETKERLAQSQLELASSTHQLDVAKKHGADVDAALALEKKAHGDDKTASAAALAQKDAQLTQEKAALDKQTADMAQVMKDKSTLKSSVDEMTKALEDANKRKAEAERRIAEYRGLLARFKTLIDAGKLKVKIVDGRMVVALASDVLFAPGSAALSKDGKGNIQEVAKLLAGIPDRKFQIEGHTDNVPIHTDAFASNWELGSARAITVLKTMVDAGMPQERVSAASFGDSKPAASNDTSEGKAQNRRIEIVVSPDLSSLPGFDELQKAGS
jgi:chemotaxis protein MotB